MKKKSFTLVLLVVILLCVVLSACNKDGSKPVVLKEDQKEFYTNWMEAIKDDTPINKIAMLGSHDSAMSTTDSAIKNMTKTQDITIAQQLEFGCRYFDIRISKNNNDNDNLTGFHSSMDTNGEKFADTIDGILTFIKAHTSEFLVLDFQHFNNNSQQAVIDKLQSCGILQYAVVNDTDMSDIDFVTGLKLGDVRGKVIIIWGSNEANGDMYPYLFRRNNDACTISGAVLDSMYSKKDNTKSSSKFIAETIPKYFDHILKKEGGLTVLQGQLTSSSLMGNLKNLESGNNKAMSECVRGIEQNGAQLAAVNIIMRDFIGSDFEKSNSVLHINVAKGYVKDSSLESFNNFTAVK